MTKKNTMMTTEERVALKKMYWRSNFLEACFNMVRLQGLGFGYAMIPMLELYYKDKPDEMKEALKRHTQFFNTCPNVVTFNLGVAAAMEKEASTNPNFDKSAINSVKTALLGPTAGIGDAIFWVVLRTLAAGIGISLAQTGSILGAIVFVLLINVPNFVVRWYLATTSYTTGTKLVEKMDESGMIGLISKGAGIIGLIMVGAMVASNVTLKTPLALSFSEVPFELQGAFDMIMPGFLPLCFSLFIVYLLRKRVNTNLIIIGIIGFAILGKFIGIL